MEDLRKKECSVCKEKKELNKFSYDRQNKDDRCNYCSNCRRQIMKVERRTIRGKIARIYSSQKENSIVRGHNKPNYSLNELITWVQQQPHFEEMFKQWKESNYNTSFAPSINRLKDSLGYSLDNIELITWKEHLKDTRKKLRDEAIIIGKAVIQYSTKGVKIAEYNNSEHAKEITKVNTGGITRCCQKKRVTAGSYYWCYADEIPPKFPMPLINKSRKVDQYSLTGEYITTYKNALEAKIITGISDANIGSVCKGKKYHKTAGGYKWEYNNDNN